jgi:hypothetical protein
MQKKNLQYWKKLFYFAKQNKKDMLKLRNILINESLTINQSSIDGIEYRDKDYSGLITIHFDADYEKIDDSFSHEFGIEEGHHYEAQNVVIESIEFIGLFQEGTNKESEIEITITNSDIFEDLAEIIEGLNVVE